MRDPLRAGIVRVVAWRGGCQLFRCKHWVKVLWVNTGIVATSLFKIDVPSSSKCVGFGTKLPRPKLYDKVKAERYSDQHA